MPAEDYSFSARLLHRLALAWPFMTRASFDLDLTLARAPRPAESKHIFIAGLARAGSTVLLQALYKSGHFRSLTYRDMPFVLMPVTWQRWSRGQRKRAELRERAHGDRVKVGFDSPEAFEEVFWRVFCGSDYLRQDGLYQHIANAEVLDQFRQFVAQVLASAGTDGQSRYLSKNNNNILRLRSIESAFPDALIVVPFRHPLQQAASLLTQHRRFVSRQTRDGFSYDYMCWLGHHEFGLGHRPFRFTEQLRHAADHDRDSLDYWLQIWLSVYTHIAHNQPVRSMLVCYEDLCKNPHTLLQRVLAEVGLPYSVAMPAQEFMAASVTEVRGMNPALEAHALELYAALRAQQES